MNRFALLILVVVGLSNHAFAQIDSSLLKHTETPQQQQKLNMDAVYNRPFLKLNKLPVALGGYVESNYQYLMTDRVGDGHEFQFRRLSLFVASSISKRIKFLSEIEFENDKDEQLEGKPMEISIEYAAIDVEFHPLLNLRSGIIVNPIGSFNQNHDGPKWEFVDRPIPATQLLPATFSNAGFGLYGKHFYKKWYWGYELYLTNGLDNTIIDNDLNKTYLPHANENSAKLSTSNSGSPLFTGKIAVRHSAIGEFGLSYMNGVYNKWMQAGIQIDHKRTASVVALDYAGTLNKTKTAITAELAYVNVQLPANYFEQFGSKQYGGFVDLVQPVYKHRILGWEQACVNLAVRVEYVDWNCGTFVGSTQNKADDLWSIMPAISFRPTPATVFRVNYRYQKQRDLIGNPPATTGGVLVGVSTYF